MNSSWQITHSEDTGERIETIEKFAIDFGFTSVANDFGRWYIRLPASRYVLTDFAIDNLIEFERQPAGGKKALEFVGIIRGRRREMDDKGKETLSIYGNGINSILANRIIAYAAGTAYAAKNSYNADNMALEIVRENFGASATNAERNLASYGFEIAPNLPANLQITPVISRAFAWRNVFTTLRAISDASAEQGIDLFFFLEPYETADGKLSFRFTTQTGQPGRDLTQDDSGIVLSPYAGNLAEPYYDEAYDDEITYVYGGGNDIGTLRYIAEFENANIKNRSIFARREAFQDARGLTNAQVDSATRDRLYKGLPVARVGGRIVESTKFRYGIEWRFGDKINIDYGVQAPGIVRAVAIRVSDNTEIITANVEAKVFTGGLFAQQRNHSPRATYILEELGAPVH